MQGSIPRSHSVVYDFECPHVVAMGSFVKRVLLYGVNVALPCLTRNVETVFSIIVLVDSVYFIPCTASVSIKTS